MSAGWWNHHPPRALLASLVATLKLVIFRKGLVTTPKVSTLGNLANAVGPLGPSRRSDARSNDLPVPGHRLPPERSLPTLTDSSHVRRRPDRYRVRRPHRRDARQHGPAAPEHPRRAPAGPAHRRRGHLRGHPAPGLPAPLRREDRRELAPDPVHPVHGPHGLPGRDEHEPRLLAGRGETLRDETAGEGQRHPRTDLRAEPRRVAPGRH